MLFLAETDGLEWLLLLLKDEAEWEKEESLFSIDDYSSITSFTNAIFSLPSLSSLSFNQSKMGKLLGVLFSVSGGIAIVGIYVYN